jgi:hypothetical protein
MLHETNFEPPSPAISEIGNSEGLQLFETENSWIKVYEFKMQLVTYFAATLLVFESKKNFI